MDTQPVPIKLKKKYLTPSGGKTNKIRSRTGPHCCGAGCASGRKKNVRAQTKRR